MKSLKEELQSEQVRHLDLSRYCVVESGTTVRATLDRMRTDEGRPVLVVRDQELVGIFTERDVLQRVMNRPETLDGPVDAVMTTSPVTVLPDTSAADALWLMDDHHFRNLPVVDRQGNILGDMTYAALIAYLGARYPVEIQNRPLRPDQYPSKPEGGD
ncbi:MAG TPA: CBS domain-containing protein [Promineifilum sp.]|nr:CBS domain-containing protein [Promineifilum sp.]HQF70613.1 CBS domain-containing protein [Promineifilum sp.]